MDAVAQLALMTKAKLVFENSETFLSFPTASPYSYTPNQLDFLPIAQDMTSFSEFSRVTNSLPGGGIFDGSLDHQLSDLYVNILSTAQLANGVLSPEQNTELRTALAFLYSTSPDGFVTPSSAAVAYKRCEQTWIRATQDYKAQQLSATTSADPGALTQWQSVDEPRLRSAVDAAEQDWESNGFKAQVAQARQVAQSSAAQSPSAVWSDWKAQCNPDIDFLTDPNNQSFAPTVFAPHDILTRDDWPTFTMTNSEIQQLVEEAPADLATALGSPSGASTIEALSFKWCSVSLSRAWLHPEMFAAQFWRMPDPSTVLSDGNTPASGSWPAYITAVIFARNVSVNTRTTGNTGIVFHPLLLATTQARPSAAPPTMQLFATIAPTAGGPVVAKPAASAQMTHPLIMARLYAGSFTTRSAEPEVLSAPPPAPQAAPQVPPTPNDADTISILAFVCKRLPKCPDPDQTLNWS